MNIINSNKIIRKIAFFLKQLSRRITTRNEIKVFGSNENEIGAVYIINLDRQKNRWKQFKKEAKFQKVKENKSLFDYCQRISAIDGKELELKSFTSDQIKMTYPLSDQYHVDPDPKLLAIIRNENVKINLTKEEIAVGLSHVKAWKKIINEKLEYALILEDDVFFDKDFAKTLNQIWLELPNNSIDGYKCDLLYLSFREVDRGLEKENFSKNIHKPVRGLWWFSGYVLSYAGAKKLLQELPIQGPVDLWINHKFNKLNVYSAKKSIITQRVDLKSDNNYSILPILSQIGIQSDKTHLILEQKKGKNPVFVISNNDLYSEFIGETISLLGYRCCINKWGEFTHKIDEIIRKKETLLFDVYSGFKSILFHYTELERLYPNAVFIIISGNNGEMVINSIEQEAFEGALEYFSNKAQNSLTVNLKEFNNWRTICNFLKCEIPTFPTPKLEKYIESSVRLTLNGSKSKLIKNKKTEVMQHDVHPWIIPMNNLKNFGITREVTNNARLVGSYNEYLNDSFKYFDDSLWFQLENSFPSNLAQFSKENFFLLEERGFKMTLSKKRTAKKEYTSASIVTHKLHLFGRFEVEMKPIKADGVITAFFLHRNDPWQEIDFEFLGNDTSKILTNVYYNPGISETNYNYGNRGTPITIDLDFDASIEYHKYTIEWEPHEIRWYVDDFLIHVRATWEPTPIPSLPMQFFINTWPSRSEELVGRIVDNTLPQSTYVKNVKIYSWADYSKFNEEPNHHS